MSRERIASRRPKFARCFTKRTDQLKPHSVVSCGGGTMHNSLDGAKLFATLEPCAPGARKHPKLGCAERIVNARIKEVWVGIEDPDPLVDRQGIKYLQEHGVTVTVFDRDLQEI